ncbi:TPA: hypothetical protein DEP58_03935 [Patescibacteria group bacterium]|nr:MAG: hypothetical protein UU98_C0005G0024 [Parcubacteria group bacterium GW2011_GWD2_42_14]HCC05424.1 hypothetical protein [Patescibacteria group bacterium]
MSTIQTTYLCFNGNAKEAMEFYQSILGGTLRLQTYGEVMGEKNPLLKDRIIHAYLEHSTVLIIARDTHPKYNILAEATETTRVRIASPDETMLSYYFTKLSKGGRVDMPLTRQVWGDAYGMLTDKFGIPWIINIIATEVLTYRDYREKTRV